MAHEFGARQDGKYYVICTMPDVCKLPNGVPVPFPVVEPLSSAVKVAKHTRFNGNWVVMLRSHTTKVTGDQPGVKKGIQSGTVGKKAEPIGHSRSVRVEGSWVVRVNDAVYMNDKNTRGKVVFAPAPQMGPIQDNGQVDIDSPLVLF